MVCNRSSAKERMYSMDVSPLSTNPAMMGIVRQLETNSAMQTAVLKQMAEMQQMMADILQELGIGQQLDIQA